MILNDAQFAQIAAARRNLAVLIRGVQQVAEAHGNAISDDKLATDAGDAFALGELMSALGFLTAADEPLGSFLEREPVENVIVDSGLTGHAPSGRFKR